MSARADPSDRARESTICLSDATVQGVCSHWQTGETNPRGAQQNIQKDPDLSVKDQAEYCSESPKKQKKQGSDDPETQGLESCREIWHPTEPSSQCLTPT